MSIESLSQEEVLSLEVPTGVPIIYQYDDGVTGRSWNNTPFLTASVNFKP